MGRFTDLFIPKSAGYEPLPENVTREEIDRRNRESVNRHHKLLRATFGAFILFALGSALGYAVLTKAQHPTKSCENWDTGYTCAPEVSKLWGQYSPFFSVPSEISPAIPENCEVTLAQVLSRHGARDPTFGRSLTYAALVARIHTSVTNYGPNVAFLKHYNYTLGADELTPFGEQQLVNSGIKFYQRYKALARTISSRKNGDPAAVGGGNGNRIPFIRSAGQHRVVESAKFWAEGFHTSQQNDKHNPGHGSDGDSDYPYEILEIPEHAPNNNTLSPDTCKAFETGSHLGLEAQREYLAIFAPKIAERLNDELPGAKLSNAEVIYLMDLCPFETVANKHGHPHKICDLFTKREWESYDYFQSLGKWYGYSSGNPLGPTQGVGFVNELIARLTGEPVKDHTTTNSTLDSGEKTFPLGELGRGMMYADFSHDNDMAAMFGALGLYNATRDLDKTQREEPVDKRGANGWAASWTVPFAARMFVEKMSCGGQVGENGREEEFVRVLVNDRVIPLVGCGVDEFGRCEVGKFVESLSFARGGGHWDLC